MIELLSFGQTKTRTGLLWIPALSFTFEVSVVGSIQAIIYLFANRMISNRIVSTSSSVKLKSFTRYCFSRSSI